MELDRDWALLRAALAELKDYLLSNELYHPLNLPALRSGGAQTSQLTIGNLLLSQVRISAALDVAHQAAYQDLEKQIRETRATWRSNWSRKAGKEFISRLNLWSQHLHELQADLSGQAAYFPTEVRQRAILQLLQPEMIEGVPAIENEQLHRLDEVLREVSRPDQFVWEPDLAKSFPSDKFWFLYITLKL